MGVILTTLPSLKLTVRTWKWMLGIRVSFLLGRLGLFSRGDVMLVSGRVLTGMIFQVYSLKFLRSNGFTWITENTQLRQLALPCGGVPCDAIGPSRTIFSCTLVVVKRVEDLVVEVFPMGQYLWQSMACWSNHAIDFSFFSNIGYIGSTSISANQRFEQLSHVEPQHLSWILMVMPEPTDPQKILRQETMMHLPIGSCME